jgi:hypothetical protein
MLDIDEKPSSEQAMSAVLAAEIYSGGSSQAMSVIHRMFQSHALLAAP